MKTNLNSFKTRRAFTLIEILMVIAIIGIIAGLTIGALKHVNIAKKRAVVSAMRESLSGAIDSYHAAYGAYPPDNFNLSLASNSNLFGAIAQTNQLFYELLSAPYNESAGVYTSYDRGTVGTADLTAVFGVGGVRNSLVGESKQFYTSPQTNLFKSYGYPGHPSVMGFIVPVELDPSNPSQPNWWHYDATTPTRHNKQSYDLWAVYSQGTFLETNGNWTK